MPKPLLELQNIAVHFGSVIALQEVSFDLYPGEVHCLLGDNGAGKSTLIKVLSGVNSPISGEIFFEGKKIQFKSPRESIKLGISTVYQDLAMIPLMSVVRNFFMGREPIKKKGFLTVFDFETANKITRDQMMNIGIDIRDPEQTVGTLSGGERQTVAIARAVYFGAKVLILDEPTSALGVRQTATVLQAIAKVRQENLGVIFITHNVRHAMAVGDRFTVLNRGQAIATQTKAETTLEKLQNLMAGEIKFESFAKDMTGVV